MNPSDHYSVDSEKVKQRATDEVMNKLLRYRNDSKKLKTALELRMARNKKLDKGIPLQDLNEYSNVRKRRKIMFRKIWSMVWRILASFYQAFLQDPNKVRYNGRPGKDSHRAKVLQKIVQFRIDFMTRRRSLFIKHMWALLDILENGYCVAKLCWRYVEDNDGTVYDEPQYTVYPFEQAFLDWGNLFTEDMRYVFLDSWMTKEQLEEEGYENVDEVEPTQMTNSELRAVRYYTQQDPLRDNVREPMPDTTYPKPGTVPVDVQKDTVSNWYRVTECFWKYKNKIYFGVISADSMKWLKKPEISPYGDIYPIVTGMCLLESHKTVGEGFPEGLEGPQESMNMTINHRKDSVELELTPPVVYDRYANVDMQSLLNRRVGGPVAADSVDAIKVQPVASTTQNAYLEVGQDQAMMEDITGLNPTKMGNTDVEKTGVANINLSEGSAKTDLYIAIVAETYFKQFYYILGHLEQKFETDEDIIGMANDQLKKEGQIPKDMKNIWDIEFDMDVTVDVGVGIVGRAAKVQEHQLLIQQATAINNSMAMLAKTGLIPPDKVRIVNTTQLFEDLAQDVEKTDIEDYFIEVPPPPPPAPAGQPGDASQGPAGQMANPSKPNDAELAAMAQRMMGA